MSEKVILEYLNSNGKIEDSGVFSASVGLDHKEIVNTIRSLRGFQLVAAEDIKKENWVLSGEGESYCELGSPEFQVFSAVPPGPEGISLLELKKKCGPELFKIGSSAAIKNKWIQIGKGKVLRKAEDVSDQLKELLLKIKDGQPNAGLESWLILLRKQAYAPRTNLFCFIFPRRTWIGYSVSKGAQFALERKKLVTDLTSGHLQSGDWENLEFKEYNVNAKVTLDGGHLHPLLKVREQFRNIFIEMGFEEMPTNNYVESSFWNFDSLFQPQQHPARDSHDTFFLNEPSATQSLPEDYVEKVKSIHESGGYGSKGYGYDWKREEANKNVLRSAHTQLLFLQECCTSLHRPTSILFSGLGVVCDRGLTLGDLMGVLRVFFERLGMKNLRFKPTYNPYTEPSMEIYSYHEGFKKWVEVGNSGMFRPEMLRPMGLPEDVTCIAWGLSLERPTMILYGIDNIRDLFGPKVDVALIKRNPICRLGINY
ncbi:hypothetical protein MKW92_008511 [Papaver armeniacum]|nr:hypothetical protein MKW92_008511 [Papaver armeniacum]